MATSFWYGLHRLFVSLRHRNFRLLWLGQLISLPGSWMQSTAQTWLVLQLTHSAWFLGLVDALQFVPMLMFVFADVRDRQGAKKVKIRTLPLRSLVLGRLPCCSLVSRPLHFSLTPPHKHGHGDADQLPVKK